MDGILGSLDFGLSVIIGVALLVILVVVHELGHAIVARRNGVVVEEFGIGFPPLAWGKKIKKSILGDNVLFSLNWLPLGGFVKLQGEHDAADKKGDYGAASLWQKTKILMAGVAMNFVVAMVLFAVLSLFGLPKALPNQFSVPGDTTIIRQPVTAVVVVENSPAAKAGLELGDEIITINNEPLGTDEDLSRLTEANAGKTVPIEYQSGEDFVQTTVTLLPKNTGDGFLGVAPAQQESIRATWSAPIVGVGTTVQFSVMTITELGKLVVNVGEGLASKLSGNEQVREEGQAALEQAGSGVAGPLGILGQIFPAAREAGVVALLYLTAIISLSLAVINILPIPALDGGRLFVTLLFRAMNKPLTKKTEEKIQATGFFVLMGLVVVVTIVDVGRFFG